VCCFWPNIRPHQQKGSPQQCVRVQWSRYRPGVAQKVGRGMALLFHDRGTRRGWVVSSTPRPHFTPGTDPVPILQESGWTPVSDWTGGKSRPHRDSIPDRPARSQSLYRISYLAHHNSVCAMQYSASVKFHSGLQSISVTKHNVIKQNNTFNNTYVNMVFETRQQLIID